MHGKVEVGRFMETSISLSEINHDNNKVSDYESVDSFNCDETSVENEVSKTQSRMTSTFSCDNSKTIKMFLCLL